MNLSAGADIFAMVDVTNYSLTYNVSGFIQPHVSGDHYQDLKRVIGASVATAHRVNVIMPFLYEGRQHKRTNASPWTVQWLWRS